MTKMHIYTPVVHKKIKSRAISPGLQRVEGERMEGEWLRWGQNSSLESSIGAFHRSSIPEQHPQQLCTLNSNLRCLMCGGTKKTICYLKKKPQKNLIFLFFNICDLAAQCIYNCKSYLKKKQKKTCEDYYKQNTPGCSLICVGQMNCWESWEKQSSTENAVSHFRSAESVLEPTTCPFKSDSELSPQLRQTEDWDPYLVIWLSLYKTHACD